MGRRVVEQRIKYFGSLDSIMGYGEEYRQECNDERPGKIRS